MPTLIGYHEIKDAQHWLSSPRREELFGPLGITNIRTFVDPQNPTRAAVLMDVPDLDAFQRRQSTGYRSLPNGYEGGTMPIESAVAALKRPTPCSC